VGEAMGVSDYANVYARIRARVGDILDEGKLRELIDARPGDFLSLLMDTAYKEQLTKAGVVTVDARRIEKALKAELIDQYAMVLRSTKAVTRDMFEEILRRLEVKNLKAIIRAKATTARKRGTEDVLIFPVEDLFKRRVSRLLEYDSLEDVLSHVESPYREILESILPEYEETKRLFVLERALDEEISDAIRSRTEKLRRGDKEIVKNIVGTELDFVNLMILLRCKAEGIEEWDLRSYLLPYAYAVDFSKAALNESISAENVSAAIRSMPTSDYKDVLTRALPLYESEKTLIPFEDALWRHFFVTVKKTLKGYPINIGTIIGFLYLKEIEIRDLCTIAVCKENDLPPEEISKLVLTA
jgi:V/A-type H+-transporting ATPase subunit C